MNPAANRNPRILILTISHGASHRRAANALRKALAETAPGATVQVEDALEHCSRWFRAYYDSYEIPLKYFPRLWQWIEGFQHQAASTGPNWLYRLGGRPLFDFVDLFNPNVVVATEVGICELAALHKRESQRGFRLVAMELMDFNRAWVQPEVDLFIVTHPDLARELEAAGAPAVQVVVSGQPIDPAFACLPDRHAARARLSLDQDLAMLLVLFGGTGFGKPRTIIDELRKIPHPFQAVFIAGKNARLEHALRELISDVPGFRVLGWVENMSDWMVAADLLISKPGGSTLTEGFACSLPMLAMDPLPGNERRTCAWIEKWGAGYWIRKPADLATTVSRLLADRQQLESLRRTVLALARPRAAYDAAAAILRLLSR